MGKSLADRLREEDLDAELEFLKWRRTADPSELDATYDEAFGMTTNEAIALLVGIWRLKMPNPPKSFPVEAIYEAIRSSFWRHLDTLEQTWRREGSDPDKKWKEYLTQVNRGTRNSLCRITEAHARGCLRWSC